MKYFAVLDDSMVQKSGIYVYTHSLVLFEEIPQILIFSGDKSEIYTHKSDIKRFLKNNIPIHYELYACNHYHTTYPELIETLQNQITVKTMDEASRTINKYFIQAHHSAKNAAQQELERILRQN